MDRAKFPLWNVKGRVRGKYKTEVVAVRSRTVMGAISKSNLVDITSVKRVY